MDDNSVMRERNKLKMEIDEVAEELLLGVYNGIKTIEKLPRTYYRLDGIVFTVDHVFSTEHNNSPRRELGVVLEVRGSEQEILPVLKKLNLEIEDGFRDPYFKM